MCACDGCEGPPSGPVYDQKYDQTLQYSALPCTFMQGVADLRGESGPRVETVNQQVTGSSPVSGASRTT
jgi:hypothetical protein